MSKHGSTDWKIKGGTRPPFPVGPPEISDKKNISNVIFDTNIRDNIKYHKNETGLERVLYDNYKNITNLTIKFVTDEGNDYDFEGIDHSITLKIKLVKMFQSGIHTNSLIK